MRVGPGLMVGTYCDVDGVEGVAAVCGFGSDHVLVSVNCGTPFRVEWSACWSRPCPHNRSLVRGLARGTERHPRQG